MQHSLGLLQTIFSTQTNSRYSLGRYQSVESVWQCSLIELTQVWGRSEWNSMIKKLWKCNRLRDFPLESIFQHPWAHSQPLAYSILLLDRRMTLYSNIRVNWTISDRWKDKNDKYMMWWFTSFIWCNHPKWINSGQHVCLCDIVWYHSHWLSLFIWLSLSPGTLVPIINY